MANFNETSRHALRSTGVAALALLLVACGGGGGGPSSPPQTPPAQAPAITFTANPTDVAQGGSSTLTWSVTNATTCTASQGWTGAKATSGSESTGALNATTTFGLQCTGPGGSASQSVTVTVVPAPTLTLTATPTTIDVTAASTLTWASTNATSCTATDGWTGTRATAGSEEVRPATTTTFTLTCTGAGGTTAPQSVQITVNPPPAGQAVVSGKIQFERPPFRTAPAKGLDMANPVLSPARDVVVQVIASPGGNVVATSATNASGDYTVLVPQNSDVFIRVRAQMVRTGAQTYDFQVRNNANGDALYTLDGSVFNVGTGATRSLTAPTGWGTTSYTGTRAAAPFAILDTVYRAKQLVTSAANVNFASLNLYWSSVNRSSDDICPNTGNVGTTSYSSGGGTDDCGDAFLGGIYVLGETANGGGDTDEFDQHVIAHEFGHYLEDRFSRSDSIGGQHGDGDRLDLRVAFGEGWGNAFSAMVLNDPIYRDSFSGVSNDFSINLEQDDTRFGDGGWFSETSIGEILWDLFDATNESGDGVTLGFGPLFAALMDGQRTTPALTSIFSFLDALRDEVPGQASAINQLRNGENISSSDEFGVGETNAGGDAANLPIYRPMALGGQQPVCVRATNGVTNKLGYNRFFRLDLPATAQVTILAVGAADPGTAGSTPAVDPDIYVHRQGALVAVGLSDALGTETISQVTLPAGTYIIEVQDYDLASGDPARCMNVSVSGT